MSNIDLAANILSKGTNPDFLVGAVKKRRQELRLLPGWERELESLIWDEIEKTVQRIAELAAKIESERRESIENGLKNRKRYRFVTEDCVYDAYFDDIEYNPSAYTIESSARGSKEHHRFTTIDDAINTMELIAKAYTSGEWRDVSRSKDNS